MKGTFDGGRGMGDDDGGDKLDLYRNILYLSGLYCGCPGGHFRPIQNEHEQFRKTHISFHFILA